MMIVTGSTSKTKFLSICSHLIFYKGKHLTKNFFYVTSCDILTDDDDDEKKRETKKEKKKENQI